MGNGDYRSTPFVAGQAGTYRWVASYSGDAMNNGVGPTACGVTAETAVVAASVGPDVNPGPNVKPPRKPSRPPHHTPTPKPKPPAPQADRDGVIADRRATGRPAVDAAVRPR